MKALYFDVETTGLSAWKNDIIQLACMVEIDGKIVEEYETKVYPCNPENIVDKALAVSGTSRNDLEAYPAPDIIHKELSTLLGKYVNKFNKTDKFTPIAYNGKFDCEFLSAFFKKNKDSYYGSWFNWKIVDPLALLYILDYQGKIALPNYKLVTVCKHFNIPIDAHDAMSDIKATRELWHELRDRII